MSRALASRREDPPLVQQVAGELRRAYQDGASECRTAIEVITASLGVALAAVAERDKVIVALIEGQKKSVEDLQHIAKSTTEMAVLDANKQIRLEQLKAEAESNARLSKLFERPAQVVTDYFVSQMPGQKKPAEAEKPAADRVVQRLLDEPLRTQIIAHVGAEDWKRFVIWAEAQF